MPRNKKYVYICSPKRKVFPCGIYWRDAGVVDRAALEMRCTGNCTGGSNPSLSAINIENQCFTKSTPDFTPENVKSGVFCLRLTIDIGAGGSLPKVVTHRLEVDTGQRKNLRDSLFRHKF